MPEKHDAVMDEEACGRIQMRIYFEPVFIAFRVYGASVLFYNINGFGMIS